MENIFYLLAFVAIYVPVRQAIRYIMERRGRK